MRFFVDEMPVEKEDCPFSSIRFREYYDTTEIISKMKYECHYCSVTRKECDLTLLSPGYGGYCSGLRTAVVEEV